jgi:hypothetical protein
MKMIPLVAMGRTSVPRIWVNRLRDLTYLRIAYPDTPVARERVLRFAAFVRAVMCEAARTGAACGTPAGTDAGLWPDHL